MYYGLKQGQITQNIDNRYVLKLIYLVAQCSKITNIVLFLKRILHHFPRFFLLFTCNVRMSDGTFCRVEVHIIIFENKCSNLSLPDKIMTCLPNRIVQTCFVDQRH